MVVKNRNNTFFSCHGTAFRIRILIIFAKPFRGNGMVFIVET